MLFIILFLYEEYLNDDIIKVSYIAKIWYKLLDFFYMYIFQYKILYIVIAHFCNSKFFYDSLKIKTNIYFIENLELKNMCIITSVFILILGIHKMFNNLVEIKTFSQIDQKFREYPYYLLPLRNKEKRDILFKKLELVAEIEDYTFFKRKRSYSFCSFEFVMEVMKRKRIKNRNFYVEEKSWFRKIYERVISTVSFNNIKLFIKSKHKTKTIKKYVKKLGNKILNLINKKIAQIKKNIKRYFRGYSTIEMQLIRILSYKKGLIMGKPHNLKEMRVIVERKIYEVVYATIFFYGLKIYLGINKDRDFFRYYIVYIYLHTVQTNLNGNVYAPLDKMFEGIDVIEWPSEVLFIIILGLNSLAITEERVNNYENIILKYGLDRDKISQLIECINGK